MFVFFFFTIFCVCVVVFYTFWFLYFVFHVWFLHIYFFFFSIFFTLFYHSITSNDTISYVSSKILNTRPKKNDLRLTNSLKIHIQMTKLDIFVYLFKVIDSDSLIYTKKKDINSLPREEKKTKHKRNTDHRAKLLHFLGDYIHVYIRL